MRITSKGQVTIPHELREKEKAFIAYRRRGARRYLPLPDFYIGTHAALAGHQLLTRDSARYRT